MRVKSIIDLSALTDEELAEELARRRATRRLNANATAMEDAAEDFAHNFAHKEFGGFLDEKSKSEDNTKKRCPRCGALCRVRERKVRRTVRSTTGVHEFRRNRHFCEQCRAGFFPLDIELDLPDEGELTSKLEGRIFDLGLHSPFEAAAQRWSLHHPFEISENQVRLVIDRVGRRAEQTLPEHLARISHQTTYCGRQFNRISNAFSFRASQRSVWLRLRRPTLREPWIYSRLAVLVTAAGEKCGLAEELHSTESGLAKSLIVATDGSMLPTRGKESWREAKLGVIYRGEHHARGAKRGLISQARYVAHLGSVEGFKAELDVALSVERANEVPKVAWLGDGAPWIWNLADEICPDAIQILDFYHAVEYAGKIAKEIFVNDEVTRKLWLSRVKALLYMGQISLLFEELEACLFMTRGGKREHLKRLIRYYRENQNRIDYYRYRTLGLPYGSGVVESGHGHVLQSRMKLTGQRWDPIRAGRLARLRAAAATAGPDRIHSSLCRAAVRSRALNQAA